MNLATAVGIVVSIVLTVAIVATAHFLQQIRDILRGIHETQKRLAARLGVPPGK